MQTESPQVCILSVDGLPIDINPPQVFELLQKEIDFLILKVEVFRRGRIGRNNAYHVRNYSLVKIANEGLEKAFKRDNCKNLTSALQDIPSGERIRFDPQRDSKYTFKNMIGWNPLYGLVQEQNKQGGNTRQKPLPVRQKYAKIYVVGEPKKVKKKYDYTKVPIRLKDKPMYYLGYEGHEKFTGGTMKRPRIFQQDTRSTKVFCFKMEHGVWNPNNPKGFISYTALSETNNAKKKIKRQIYRREKDEEYSDYFGDFDDYDYEFQETVGQAQLEFFKGTKKFEKKIRIKQMIISDCPYDEIPEEYFSTEFTFDLIQKAYLEEGGSMLYLEVAEYARFRVLVIDEMETFYEVKQYDFDSLYSIDDELLRTYAAQSTVIKLFIYQRDRLKDFLDQLKSMGIQVLEFPYGYFESDYQRPFLTYDILSSSLLSYSVKYALLACLSQKKINLFHISEEFLSILEDGVNGKPLLNYVIEKTLTDIGNQNENIFEKPTKESSMKAFEEAFWKLYRENEASREQWREFGAANNYIKTKKVSISPTKIIYHLPEAELSNSILRRHRNYSDEFLRLTFTDDRLSRIQHIPKEVVKEILSGFIILTKTFKFLAFSSSQLRNSSLWMLAESRKVTVGSIYKEIGDLSAIQIPAKHGARLGQLFSSSTPGIEIDKNIIDLREIQDITVLNATKDGKYTFSDGIGKISSNLMHAIKHNLKKEGYMSAIQIRYGGNKGVLVEDPELRPNTICFRPSMIKFTNSTFDSSLEILDHCRYLPAYLNRQIIILLLTNGISNHTIAELSEENIVDLYKKEIFEKVITEYINNKHQYTYLKKLIITSLKNGISITDEPFLNGIFETIRVRSFLNLRDKCSIFVKKGARLMGVLDQYNVLKYGQVYACISPSNGEKSDDLFILTGRLLVTKNPCLHPGDIKVLEGVNNEETKKKLKHLVNCVVFPAQGPRPHTDEISGSDLDGDVYFLSWDERLIPNRTYPSMSYTAAATEKQPVTTEKIIDFFADYIHSDILGKIDNGHLAFADSSSKLAAQDICIDLAIMHSEAVDYAKSGVCPTISDKILPKRWPDYMEKTKKKTYRSSNMLGDTYRSVRTLMEKIGIDESYKDGSKIQKKDILIDESMIYDGFECYLEEAFEVLCEYYKEIEMVKSIYKLQTEYEIYSGSFLRFLSLNKQKAVNLEKLQQSVFYQFQELKSKFWRILRETTGIDLNNKQELKKKASACYIASYYNSKYENERIVKAMEQIEYSRKLKSFFESFKQQYLGLPWLVFNDELLEIRRSCK